MELGYGETLAEILDSKHMKVTKKSPITGIENSLVLPITEEQFTRWMKGELIQNAMPHLSVDEREFLISGCFGTEFDDLTKEKE